jgi:ABC-type multidrug transport system ATPase subunit
MSVIEVRGLIERFGPGLAVDQLSFEAERGTSAGLPGANGAGKTTRLRMPLGLAIVSCAVAARTTVARDVS